MQSRSALSKIDVIQKHITASIQLIAIEANPFSVHLPVMAAEELIRQVANARKLPLPTDFRLFIKDEHHKEYLKKSRSAYNWFKHADRDPDSDYSGPSISDLTKLNEVQTLINIMSFSRLSRENSAEIFASFTLLMMVKYPQYVRDDFLKEHPFFRGEFDCSTELLPALRTFLRNSGLLPTP